MGVRQSADPEELYTWFCDHYSRHAGRFSMKEFAFHLTLQNWEASEYVISLNPFQLADIYQRVDDMPLLALSHFLYSISLKQHELIAHLLEDVQRALEAFEELRIKSLKSIFQGNNPGMLSDVQLRTCDDAQCVNTTIGRYCPDCMHEMWPHAELTEHLWLAWKCVLKQGTPYYRGLAGCPYELYEVSYPVGAGNFTMSPLGILRERARDAYLMAATIFKSETFINEKNVLVSASPVWPVALFHMDELPILEEEATAWLDNLPFYADTVEEWEQGLKADAMEQFEQRMQAPASQGLKSYHHYLDKQIPYTLPFLNHKPLHRRMIHRNFGDDAELVPF